MAQLDLTDEEKAKLLAENLNDGDELAPLPSKEELFGEKMEALKSEYQESKEKYDKDLEEQQNKVQQSLQDKLAARRQRRARKNIEDAEKSALES